MACSEPGDLSLHVRLHVSSRTFTGIHALLSVQGSSEEPGQQTQEEIPEDDRSVYKGEGRRRLGSRSHQFRSALPLLTSLGQIKQEVLVSHVPEGRLVAVLCSTIISH